MLDLSDQQSKTKGNFVYTDMKQKHSKSSHLRNCNQRMFGTLAKKISSISYQIERFYRITHTKEWRVLDSAMARNL